MSGPVTDVGQGDVAPGAGTFIPPRRWRVELADKATRTVEARGFRVEGGALVLLLPAGCVAAYAPGTWHTIEEQ